MRRVRAEYLDGVGRPKQQTIHNQLAQHVPYAFPHASPGSSAVPDEATRTRTRLEDVPWQGDAGVAFELTPIISEPQPGSEDLEHLAPSPPVLCADSYTVWESYKSRHVGRLEAVGPMYQPCRLPAKIWSTRCNEDVRAGAAPVPAEHARLRHVATGYSIPDEWIPRGTAKARPNHPVPTDPGESTSVTHPNFAIWRNTDANLECRPLTEGVTDTLAAKGWKQSVDAEGKTICRHGATGRVSYQLGDVLRS